jgi:hypothetical protein
VQQRLLVPRGHRGHPGARIVGQSMHPSRWQLRASSRSPGILAQVVQTANIYATSAEQSVAICENFRPRPRPHATSELT